MNPKSAMGQRIKELRKAKGLTQEQLAQKIGISMAAIRNYENGLREPNSRAMAALERYFKVSGEYLRGESNQEGIHQNSTTIQGHLDDLDILFQSFKCNLNCSSKERQMLAVSLLSGVMQTVTEQLLRYDGPIDLDGEQINLVVRASFNLNSQGQAELAKRAGELTQLTQYCK